MTQLLQYIVTDELKGCRLLECTYFRVFKKLKWLGLEEFVLHFCPVVRISSVLSHSRGSLVKAVICQDQQYLP